MRYNRGIHHRRSIRLKGYNYGQVGFYFVTICTWQSECILATVTDSNFERTEVGKIALTIWQELTSRFDNIVIDAFIVMPNHVHGIIQLCEEKDSVTLPRIIQTYKSLTAIAINRCLGRAERPLWQRNYYEQINQNEVALRKIRDYIRTNPLRWEDDEENPVNQVLSSSQVEVRD